jgi:hypothetical protein
MKSFVRDSERNGWDALRIVVIIGTMMFAAETLGEIAYLPLYGFLAIEFTRKHLLRRQRSKALLGGDRSTGSR